MSEKYYIENNKELEINIDYFVKKVSSKQKSKYGENSANATLNRVQKIYQNCIKQLKSNDSNKNVLLIGKVQSGKTSNLEMLTAFAFDNGFNCVIIYGGYDNNLLGQTSKRFRMTFDIDDDDFETKEPELFSTDDLDVNTLDKNIINKIIEYKKPIIFVSMKRPVALKKINNLLSELNKEKINPFIIDDEGDQASLNTKFKKSKQSSTYSEIVKMKEILNNPLYISVTATPQANVLLGEYSELQPKNLYLIEPGIGYTGAEFFHLNDEKIIFVDDNNEENKNIIPNSLYDAINYFLVASAIMNMKNINESFTDMIIHTSRTRVEHSNLYQYVYNYISSLKENIEYNNDEISIQLDKICDIYNEKYFNENIMREYKISEIRQELEKIIVDTYVILQDSNGKVTQGQNKFKNHKIYIGGDLLQRGLTFDKLITTYFTRWPKKEGNMDTIIQRARWLGYRINYLDFCKIFTTVSIQKEYANLAESENDLWEQCFMIENGEIGIDDIVIDANDSTLNPTRKNVVSYKRVKFSKKWNNQKIGIFDMNINKKNNEIIDKFISNYKFINSSIGRIGSTIPTCIYAEIKKDDFINLIYNVKNIFDFEPFNKNNLKKLVEDYKIILQIMCNSDGKVEQRMRLFDTDCKIHALQQGPSKSNEGSIIYSGDSSVIVDETAMTVQLFKITPRIDNNKDVSLEEHNQYMFSIHIPHTRKGFIKDEFKTNN